MKHENHETKTPMYANIGLFPVKNGFRLSYYKRMKPQGAGKLDPMHEQNFEEVFKDDEGDKAVKRLMELSGADLE